jgi:hypothetical protein
MVRSVDALVIRNGPASLVTYPHWSLPSVQSVQQSHVLHVSYHRDPRTAEPVRLPQTRSSASRVSSKGSSIHFSAFPRKCFPKNEVKLLGSVFVFCVEGVCEKFKHTRTPYHSSTRTVVTNEALRYECVRSRESDRKKI